MNPDLHIAFGGAVKATGPTTIEGLLIPYGSPDDLDADGEFFDARTDFGLRLPVAVKLFYHHGMNAKVGKTPLAWADLERRDDGVWFKADLADDLAEWEAEERAKALKFRAVVLKLARDGALGASSGAAAHVVVRKAVGKGTRISRWPLAEASVTPTPSNSRTLGTVSLKALAALPDPLEAPAPISPAVAAHEAAHITVAAGLGLPVAGVGIRTNGEGWAAIDPHRTGDDFDLAAVAVSGVLGAYLYEKGTLEGHPTGQALKAALSAGDLAHLAEALGDCPASRLESATRTASRLLRQHRTAWEAFTEQLESRAALCEHDVRRLAAIHNLI